MLHPTGLMLLLECSRIFLQEMLYIPPLLPHQEMIEILNRKVPLKFDKKECICPYVQVQKVEPEII